MDVFVNSTAAISGDPRLAQAVTQIIHTVFREPPWNFDWACGTASDPGGSKQCTAWGFVNLLFQDRADFILLGPTLEEIQAQPHAALCGVAAGMCLTADRIAEFSLEKVQARPGDYYFATIGLRPEHRGSRVAGTSATRRMVQCLEQSARACGAKRMFARTIVGVAKMQRLLPDMGFASLGEFRVVQAGQESLREYFRWDFA